MADRSVLSRFSWILPPAAVAGLLLVALFLVAGVEQGERQLGRLSLLILVLTGVSLLVLLAAIAQRAWKLVRELRRAAPGARLRARLVLVFLALAVPPAAIVFLFSVEFLDNTIDGWFDTGAEPALADALEITRLYLDERTRLARNRMQRIAAGLPSAAAEERRIEYLFDQISSAGPSELAILDSSGQVQALVHIDPERMVAALPSAFALDQVLRGEEYATAEESDRGLRVRVLVPLNDSAGLAPGQVLQGIFPLPDSFSGLAARIEQAYFRFETISFLRQRLQQSFVLILSLVLGITVLLAILLAFNAARRLVRPIGDLARATERIGRGELPEPLEPDSHDELGFLVESFNSMARDLDRSRQQLEGQRHYLETLLGRLSAGVIAFDADQRLTAANSSASDILGIDLDARRGQDLDALAADFPPGQELFGTIRARIRDGSGRWRREIRIDRAEGTLALVCRGSSLADPDAPERTGHVVVFDDVTMLDQAQRQAAWAELARRLAHEIKNPLTPIRLAAERLKLKLESHLQGADAELVARSTGTIIKQVDLMRDLVDSFGDYARPASTRREPIDPGALIEATVELWSAGDSGVTFELAFGHGPARPPGDPGQFQQILNNLVQNAREAHPQGRPTVRITTSVESGEEQDWLVIAVEDNGPGFDAAMLERVFEPYVTSKPRGTGLGLAIVHRLVEQLGGRIEAGNRPGGGARLVLRLPLPGPVPA